METSSDYWNYGERYAYDLFKRTRTVAGIEFTLPKKPNKEDIDGYGLRKEEQYFRPPDEKMVNRVNQKLRDGDELTDDESDFIDTQWYRRTFGYWFYNGGFLEYITGLHYFYISAHKIPITPPKGSKSKSRKKSLGLPLFSDADRDRFYWWEYGVEQNPRVFGGVEVTRRRSGKTHRGNVTNYDYASKLSDVFTGMQSKTGPDAKQVFKKLVNSWKHYPEYFKPVDVGDSDPQSSLRFKEPSKKDTKSQFKDYSKVLNSEITYQPAGETAYDGWDLVFYFMDEAGKTKEKEANVHTRWEVVKETLTDGSTITGKALITTTVEDMEKDGGKNLKKIWDESDLNNVNELGETTSGLVRIFCPAYYGYRGEDVGKVFVDEFGYSNIKAAKEFLEKRRANLKGPALTKFMRKYPFTVEEAFRSDNKHQIFPDYKIYEQLDYNSSLSASTVVRGNFEWKEGIEHSMVEWHPREDGRWLVSRLPAPDIRNKRIWDNRRGIFIPGNQEIYASGCDPFDHSLTTEHKKSSAASHVIERFNPMKPYHSHCFVSEYIYRQSDVHDFYDDMIKQCVFYGMQMLVENNKIGLINYMKRKGYIEYLMDRPHDTHTPSSKKQREKGIPLSGKEVRNNLLAQLDSYILHYVGVRDLADKTIENTYGLMYFDATLNDWLLFDPSKWTDYDATVSAALTVAATQKYISKETKKFDVGELISTIRRY